MKEKLKKLFLALLGIGFVAYLLVTAAMDLTNTKDIRTIHGDGAVQLLKVEHAINGLIPIGNDYYYFVMDGSTNDACIVKASPRWYKKNFDQTTGNALQPAGIEITSLAKRETDFDIREELASRMAQIEGVRYITEPGYALNLNYKVEAIIKLALLAVLAVAVVWGMVIVKRRRPVGKTEGRVYAVLAMVFLVLLLKVIL